MPREQSKKSESKIVNEGGFARYTTPDGKEILIPMFAPQMMERVDGKKPQPDESGKIPEFVNTTHKIQLMAVEDQPDDSFEVKPWERIFGEQWRHYAEPNKAWGHNPPFMERVRAKDGEYDPKYNLTAEQSLAITKKIINPHEGPKKLRIMLEKGKVQSYDETGQPVHHVDSLREDRLEVADAINVKIRDLDREHDRRMEILTGKRRPQQR